jgi:KipI family sensor histidine kinase inhibitor
MRIHRAGDAALLVETGDLALSHRLRAALRDARVEGVVDVVPGEKTVLVTVDPARCDLSHLAARIPGLPLATSDPQQETVEIPVVYDGEDLAEVARLTGRSESEVVALHRSAAYTVAYLGFAPGFAYITGLDPALHLPRRATPRTSVPAGSVAIAGPYTSVYPSATPGGWHLIGHSPLPLWDTHRDPPTLLQPGTAVTFTEAS